MTRARRLLLAFSAVMGVAAMWIAGAWPTLAQPLPLSPNASYRTPNQPGRFRQMGRRQVPLSSYLDNLIWDPKAQGNLLIIGAEVTFQPGAPRPRQLGSPATAAPEPEKSPAGDIVGYKLDKLGAYFAGKTVGMHSLSVFAPTMMTVFEDRHLPRIDPYAALTSSDKERLLESTFSAEQWSRLGSADGIGASDMTAPQRDIYLSLLPEPFVVQSNAPTNEDGQSPPITLTPDQRAGVRLSLSRELSWRLAVGTTSSVAFGLRPTSSPSEPYSLVWRPQGNGFDAGNTAYGVALTSQSPNRAKPDQLTDDLRHSEAMIPLDQDQTLGALVERIGKATGAELHADKRYARLSIVVRGTSAEAGDLLRAIAIGVTGTWRRVGPAYILTNDLEGLGVHHARIADWMARNRMLIAGITTQVNGALAGINEADRVPWLDGDPLRPNDALQAKLADPALKRGPVGGLFVPLNELPSTAQTQIADQLKSLNENRQRFASPAGQQSPLDNFRTDGVNVNVSVKSAYIIPGIATVAANDIRASTVMRIGARDTTAADRAAAPADNAVAFPESCPVRALLVSARDGADIATAVREARRAGFTQLWFQVPRDDKTLLPEAIRQAKPGGLSVYAVVRLLQPTAADPPTARDRNLLGETSTEYAREKRAEMREFGLVTAGPDVGPRMVVAGLRGVTDWGWRDSASIDLVLQKGDYLPAADADVRARLTGDLTKLAAIPDLGGVILRDAYPVGYERADPIAGNLVLAARPGVAPINDALLGLGYTEALRLKAIRQIGCDPIDLSPIVQGDQVPLGDSPSFVDISLPFFRDTGFDPAAFDDDAPAEGTGAENPALLWNHLRADVSDALVHAVTDGIHEHVASIPVYASAEEFGDRGGYYFGSVDPPGDKPTPAPTDASAIAPGPARISSGGRREADPVPMALRLAKAASKSAYYGISIAVEGKDADADALVQLTRSLRRARGWDGVVVDLTEMAPARAAALLHALPNAPAAAL